MSRIYGTQSYQLGAAQIGGQLGTDAITPSEKAQADRELKRMRSALEKWLKYRTLLGTPPGDISPVELRLGKRLHVLLREMFDTSQLPSESNVLQLAQIAVAGKLSNELSTSTGVGALGFIWLWPAVAVVGLVLMTVVTKIKSDAEDAADARQKECIMAGKCTDTGFWLKAGAVAFVAWLAWEKFGLKKMVNKAE